MRTFLSLCVAIMLLATAPVAHACSMSGDYRTPTNFELLEKADLVVLGRLQPEPSGPAPADDLGSMRLQPIRVLKGVLPDEPLTITGSSEWNGVEMPSLPTSLGQSHFSTGMGACVRIFYPRGGLILAMFERGPEGWAQSWAAFARTAEDVEAEDGIWVRAAKAYLALQARHPPAQWRQALEAWLAELSVSPPDPLHQALAVDLQHHLSATANSEPRPRAPFWSLLNMPGQAAAAVADGRTDAERGNNPGSAAMACQAGNDALLIVSHGTDQVHQLTLTVGERRFEVADEQIKSSFGERYLEGSLPLTEEMLSALASPAASVGVSIGGTLIKAPPADALPLLARQCRQLRTQPPLPGAEETGPITE